jgi:hypothetical protein
MYNIYKYIVTLVYGNIQNSFRADQNDD